MLGLLIKTKSNKIKSIEISSLFDYPTVQEFLIDLVNPSRNKLKKYFDKKFLVKKLFAKQTLLLPINFVNDGEINPVYVGPQIDTLYEDEELLVINKPHQIYVHPLSYDESDNCLSYMRMFPRNSRDLFVNKTQYDRGLLYRLDYETSGLLIYIRNEILYHQLRISFHEIAKEKIYFAWVCGDSQFEGELVHYLKSSEKAGMKMQAHVECVPNSDRANLFVRKIRYDESLDRTLLEISLKTGHRHQIRVQLAAMGNPIVGDPVYGERAANRLYLHASKYSIFINGQLKEFHSDSPDF